MNILSMTRAEREAFLAGFHVGVFAVDQPGHGPVATPVWYGYEPGGSVWFATGRESLKARLAEAAGRASFIVQEEGLPYRYVNVEGPVTIAGCDYERHLKPMAYRYLGEEGGERYLATSGAMSNAAESVVIHIHPETWRTQDFGKMPS